MSKQLRTKLKRVGMVAVAIIIGIIGLSEIPIRLANAESCPDLRIIFARGSGGERWTDQNYLEFRRTLEEKLATVSLNYEFIDLDYPAVGIGLDNLNVALGAYFGAGETYEFGDSVNTGVDNLTNLINGASCPQTKYVLGGYSQGAMVISKALNSLKPERIIYAATFGDPKIYLPEGAGIIPAACRNENLSDYRMYVPDCQAYKGLLGAFMPYEPEAFTNKIGTWCNRRDIFCSSHLSITNHVNYISDGLYEDASRVMFNKITTHFGLENHISSPHDTAILIDSTGSMTSMIEDFKAEALRLAKETLNSGGRVALYDYRDLDDPYEAVEHCSFETCTLEVFERELAKIETDGGGDEYESLLSSSIKMMTNLNWKYGATKSLVVLTDAGFLAPDRDGVTLKDVTELSKRIDPVNFYIITSERAADEYAELADETDGLVVTNFDELHLLTDFILGRYDSLPRVEETDNVLEHPSLEIMNSELISDNAVRIVFTTDAEKTLVVLNEQILGTTTERDITIAEIDGEDNQIILVPISGDYRGEGVLVNFSKPTGFGLGGANEMVIPKAPNTGRK